MGEKYLYDLNKEELGQYLASLDEPKYRAEQIYTALHKGTDFEKINIPKALKDKFAADFVTSLPKISKEHKSADGTRKYLLELNDGQLIETVLLVQDYGNTICISSQVGCRMGCAFCASGTDGLIRNLTAGEMLAQVLLLNRINKLSHIVIMGSGEPFDSFDNTIKFLNLVTAADGINIGARNISVSTSGIVPKIKAFADLKLQVNLCISLHAPNDEIRQKIMPVAKAYPIGELVSAAKYFFDKTKRRVIFEYSLIDDVNCAPEHAVELAKLLRGFPAHVNLINLNRTPGSPLQPPSREVAMKFMDTLIKSGASCTMRKSRGDDIAAACGQLKLQSVSKAGTSSDDKP